MRRVPKFLLIFVNKSFVRGHDATKAFHQAAQMIDIVWARCQQWKMSNHAPAGNAQPQFEAVVIHLFSGAMAPVGEGRKTLIPKSTPRVGADRQRDCLNGWHRIKLLPGALDEQGLT